jgi:hypothetical protein
VRNFTRAQLRRLPTKGRHMGHGRSVVWLTHVWRHCFIESEVRPHFELSSGERVRHGQVLPLGDRALDILMYLADRPGEVIAKQELIDHVWSDVIVEEGASESTGSQSARRLVTANLATAKSQTSRPGLFVRRHRRPSRSQYGEQERQVPTANRL